jgi:hypothetical protein
MFMISVGFKPTIPTFERSNTVYALERLATVIDEQPEPIFHSSTILFSGICC